MELEPRAPPCAFFDLWFRPRELWGYWLVHIVVPPIRLQTPSAPWLLSLAPSLWTVLHPMDDCEHPLLYLPGIGRASQETAISGSCHQALVGNCLVSGFGGCLWLDPQVGQFLGALNFVSLTSSMGILFPILRRNEVSTLWSSFFLSFMCFANCIFGSLSFWANIHLSVSAYHVCSFVIGLPRLG